MLRRLLTASRFVILIGVFGSLVAAASALVMGAVEVVVVVKDLLHGTGEHAPSVHGWIEVVDLYLVGTVLYVVALGLYRLFFDETFVTPAWLKIATLDDLKDKLAGVVILSLSVSFLGSAVDWQGDPAILYFGAAVALVILALSWQHSRRGHGPV